MTPNPLLFKLQDSCFYTNGALHVASGIYGHIEFFMDHGATKEEAHTLRWELFNVYGISPSGLQFRNK